MATLLLHTVQRQPCLQLMRSGVQRMRLPDFTRPCRSCITKQDVLTIQRSKSSFCKHFLTVSAIQPVTKHSQQLFLRTVQLLKSHRTLFTSVLLRAKPKRLPFEMDANVLQDTVVFAYKNDRFYRMMSVFGIMQFFFWANLALFSYSGLDALDKEEGQKMIDKESWWGKLIGMQMEYKYRLAATCLTIGYVVLFFTWLYPQRTVRQLTLLRGGEKVRFTTYTHFGRHREFEVPLDHLSSKASRTAKSSQLAIKVKGKWFYYLVDKSSGTFYEARLFDTVIALKRNLK